MLIKPSNDVDSCNAAKAGQEEHMSALYLAAGS